jgi:demethylmenaquinone methyltransferase/2-methoxy-6-polyprenyl-1,4-benzoquinol methylase
MFARIAGRYDLLNRVLSLGIDRTWRRRTVRVAEIAPGGRVVDVCCGTGDLALEFARSGVEVVGVDFTFEMLALATPKRRDEHLLFAHGDALHLPLRDAVADASSVAFGLRNLADPIAGLREMARVVRPGGRVLVLEFAPPPKGPLGFFYNLYFTRVLPWIGGIISGDREAYSYLPRTVVAWPPAEEVRARMQGIGLEDCGFVSLTGGIAYLHWGRVPAGFHSGAGSSGSEG